MICISWCFGFLNRDQDHRNIIQIPTYMFSKRFMKNMKFHCSYKEPEYHQTTNCSQTSAHFFIYYMLFQIDYPGTVQPQVNTIAALVCKISCKSIFRSYQPAEISQKHAYQNYSIRQHPLFIICHENSSLIVYFYNKYTIKLCFII